MAEKGGHRCYSEYPFARYEGVAGHQGSRCGKGYVYLLPETLQGEQTSGKVSSSVTDNIRYIEFSGNMIVIRTKAGYAKAVGVMVDNEDYDDVLGTLSGDDTVFVLLAEGVKPLDFLPSFDSIHPNIKTLYNPEGRKKNNGAMRRRFF